MGKEISEDEFIGDIKVDLKPIFQKGEYKNIHKMNK